MMKLYLSILFLFYLMNAKGVNSEPPDILRLHIQSDIRMRFATTQITSLVANNNNYSQEVTFNVNLPEEAFISSFKMVIDDVEYPGEVKEKEQAKKAYEKAKRKGQSAGHVAKKPRDTNKFKININVAALRNVTFEVRYQELLRRKLGLYEHSIYVNPGQPVEDVKIQVYIEESKEIRILRVPPLRSTDPTFTDATPESTTNPDATISRPSIKTAEITYVPSDTGTLDGIFEIKYDIDRRKQFNGDILAVNGYFVHFFAPADLEPIPKDILFILDTSGSMSGRKIAQVIQAMIFIMHDLVEGDRFNIMDFDDQIIFWKPTLQPWNPENVKDSLKWVRQRRASGGTNINHALLDGLDLMSTISNITSEDRSPVIVFLTDGAASSGVTRSTDILRNVAEANEKTIPVFSLSFGADADFTLLQKISLQNYAVARRIYEASDSAIQLKNFYNEISAALMTDVKFKYFGNVDNDTLTNNEFHRYFNGTEAVIAGKLTDKDASRITWNIIGSTSSGGIDIGETTEALQLSDEGKRESLLSDEDIKSIPEKLWAYLTIKQILDQMTASDNQTEKDELKNRAIELSLKYKFVTPVTSMIVVKPDKKENTDEDAAEEASRDRHPPARPAPVYKRVNRPPPRGGSYGDPHFLVKLKNVTYPICYKMPAKPGELMTLIYDPVLQINVTGKIREGTGSYKPDRPNRTYIGKVYIKTANIEIMIATHQIVFNGKRLIWKNESDIAFNGASCEVNGKGTFVEVKINPGLTFLIRRNLHARMGPKYGYLDFFLMTDDGFSPEVSGVVGRFIPMTGHLMKEHKISEFKTEARLKLTEPRIHYKRAVHVVMHKIQDLMFKIPCWKIDIDKLGF
ncbi:inter-alpha-trypsin inhibitor heavy chain H3 isoform X2 [Octopus sinensis]|uniref:Inter-alpha-trypsin inhibitor heavy chain H3 isoform X2 n=1 Tax=Octopus sinensis TaxID=2607531 RepID=A0A6P7T992_9MOLL|nr:inter-alpha-trypsin inhibitor heavy chain H3 isoform X2 [Octopus sinensis]